MSNDTTRRLAPGTAICLVALLIYDSPALAHEQGAKPIPDGHAPAGVMVDHMHKAGEFMVGYRYSWARQSGDQLDGTSTININDPSNPLLHRACQNEAVAGHEHCSMYQTEMTMQMHMLDIMYAPTDWMTLMVMPQWMTMDMTMDTLPFAHHDMGHGEMDHMGSHGHGTDGLGDTIFGALIKISSGPGYSLHTGMMFSAPTGSTTERASNGNLTHYMMQLGSGTWDFLPSLTYNGRADRLSWGVQLSGIIRMEDENDQGYRLGDVFQATGWAAYRLTDWMSASVRLLSTRVSQIEGSFFPTGSGMSAPDFPTNYGGSYFDVGLGVNFVVPDGALKGHRLSVEWLEPVRDDVNGYQQERDGTLYANWSKAF